MDLLRQLLSREVIPDKIKFIDSLPTNDWDMEMNGIGDGDPDKDKIFIKYVKRNGEGNLEYFGECHGPVDSINCSKLSIKQWIESVSSDAIAFSWDNDSSEHYNDFEARIWREYNDN